MVYSTSNAGGGSQFWDTFMMNHSGIDLHGLKMVDIVEPPLDHTSIDLSSVSSVAAGGAVSGGAVAPG